ncbi:MAG: proton-conducting transporter membrane subunit [Bacteroidota bacterium]
MKLRDQLHDILHDLSFIGSETVLVLGAIVLLVTGLITKHRLLLKLIFSITLIFSFYLNIQLVEGGLFLSDSLFMNAEIVSFASLFIIAGLSIVVFPRKKHGAEFYFFILALVVGSIFMMKANSLLIIYLSIELVSFVSYILTSFSFRKEGHEAGIKYLLFGALSSAIMLIGLGLIYGITQSFYISIWTPELFSSLLVQVGVLFLVFGVFFKCAIFPFHMWTPATYQSAPVDAVALFSIVPKLGGLVLLKRVFLNLAFDFSHWLILLVLFFGMATIIVGTFGALRQFNTRRMISFGSIAHSGFLLGLVITPSVEYKEAFWWYSSAYTLMNLAAFYVINRYEDVSIYTNSQYSLSKKETLMAGGFTLILVSLVGIPPLAGFTAKLFLFTSLWEIFIDTGSKTSLTYLLVSVFATVASLFFYMRIPYYAFLHKNNSSNSELSIVFSQRSKIIATIFAILLLVLFFTPKLIMSLQSLLNNVHE